MIKDTIPNKIPDHPRSNMSREQLENMPLTAVVPGLEVDIERLQHHLRTEVMKYPEMVRYYDPVKRPNHKYSGWSVTSSTGDVHSGWESQEGYSAGGLYNPQKAFERGHLPRWMHIKKTQICTGYLEEIVDQVDAMGFYPCRVRIWNNQPGCRIGIHTDGPRNMYNVRLHIPIITNPDCVHVWYTDPETRIHYPADGRAHMFRTNISHDTFNNGSTDRYHLIFEVWDTRGIVPGYKFDGIEEIKAAAKKHGMEFNGLSGRI